MNILSIFIVLFLGWKNGILVGTTAGVTIGVTLGIIAQNEPTIVAVYAISGMLAGILNRFGRIGVIVGFLIGNGILLYTSKGDATNLVVFKEALIASLGLLAIPKWVGINIEELISIISRNYNNWARTMPRNIVTGVVDFHNRFHFWGSPCWLRI